VIARGKMVWNYIRRGWGRFSRSLKYEVGDGSKIRFWHDLWCGYQPLNVNFSEIISIARCKEAWVADHMQFFNVNLQCNISFRRPLHGWEVDLVISFFDLLYSIKLRHDNEDKICWIPSKRRTVEVRSFYHVLSIWRGKTPSTVTFFVWAATLGRILILNNLRKKSVIVVDTLLPQVIQNYLRQVLYVQEVWRVHISFFASL
jgi:hypothetical protein